MLSINSSCEEMPIMSVQVIIDLPEDVFSALRSTPDHFAAEMRLAAAVKWYEMGLVDCSESFLR